jgi:hypothetical protein
MDPRFRSEVPFFASVGTKEEGVEESESEEEDGDDDG